MDLIENIIHYFKHGEKEKEKASPLGTCPICQTSGHQQPQGQLYADPGFHETQH